jgi:hypothetical protein
MLSLWVTKLLETLDHTNQHGCGGVCEPLAATNACIATLRSHVSDCDIALQHVVAVITCEQWPCACLVQN